MLLFNRYQYQPSTDLIGKGELTRVYKALDKYIYLPVAVKIYRGNEQNQKYGLNQIKRFISMDHPNICRYLHIEEMEGEGPLGEKEKMQVCVMELVQDGDFASYYRARKNPELLRKMATDILRGLSYLHSQGIVHRRLKPSNLLVGETTQGPVVKITDFGLGSGKAALRDARLSSIVVEVTHMAPEQFNPRKYGVNGKVTYHLDFWAFGLAIYEALTDNDVLFKDSPEDSNEQVMENILSPTLPEKIKRLPSPFDKVVARCLAKHADDRVQNTRELLLLLLEPITAQDDVYETMVLPAMKREEEAAEEPEETDDLPMKIRDRIATIAASANRIMTRENTDSTGMAGAPKIIPEKTVQPPAGGRDGGGPAGIDRDSAGVGRDGTGGGREGAGRGSEEAPAPARSDDNHLLFNRYEYNPRTSLIGKGGFSRVYKAYDKKLGRWVALKLYKSGEFSDRYSPIAEIRRVINLDHPNICRYLDIEEMEKENAFGEKELTQICVMELLDGGNLLEYHTANPTTEVLKKLVTDVLKGLAYLHKNGIIHRDIKPANILIKESYDGAVAKITDFGISKLSDSVNNHSSSALVVSIPYMAPEQLNVKRYGIEEKISYNLDLWGLGVTIYETLTGKILFKDSDHDSSEQIMANIMSPDLPEKIRELPQPFLDVVRRCVVKNARLRVQRAEELIELINRPTEEARPEIAAPVVGVAKVETPPVVEVGPVAEPAAEVVSVAEAVPVVENAPVVEAVPETQPVAEHPTTFYVEMPEKVEEIPEAPVESMVVGAVEPIMPEKTMRAVQAPRIPPGLVIEEPAPQIPPAPDRRHRRIVAGLRIAIAAAVLLLAGSVYLYMQHREGATAAVPTQKADSVSIVSDPAAVKPPVGSSVPGGTDRTPQKDSAKAAGAITETAKKPRRERKAAAPAETENASGGTEKSSATDDNKAGQETGAGGGEAVTAKYVLLLSTPVTCTININNAPYGTLESGKTMKVFLAPGDYVIQATSAANSSAVYTGRLEVKQENLNQVGKYKIPL